MGPLLAQGAMAAVSGLGAALSARSQANAAKKLAARQSHAAWAAHQVKKNRFDRSTKPLIQGAMRSLGIDPSLVDQVGQTEFGEFSEPMPTYQAPGIGSYIGALLSGGSQAASDIYGANQLNKQMAGSESGSGATTAPALANNDAIEALLEQLMSQSSSAAVA